MSSSPNVLVYHHVLASLSPRAGHASKCTVNWVISEGTNLRTNDGWKSVLHLTSRRQK